MMADANYAATSQSNNTASLNDTTAPTMAITAAEISDGVHLMMQLSH